MFKAILILVAFNCTILVQFPQAQTHKTVRKAITPGKSTQDKNDSAYIYNNLGWTAYKVADFGVARYYWELGSNYNTKAPAKYACAFRLGLLHQMGEGVGIDYEKAYNYYLKAAANGQSMGNVDATKNIASYYENGIYLPKDNSKALEWYLKAKAQGNKFCDEDIARVRKFLVKGWVNK